MMYSAISAIGKKRKQAEIPIIQDGIPPAWSHFKIILDNQLINAYLCAALVPMVLGAGTFNLKKFLT
jgi:hypothetical protein